MATVNMRWNTRARCANVLPWKALTSAQNKNN
jgi:hypothetical protein